MPGSSNFIVWNPNAYNQENDTQYGSDPQRTNGGIDGQPFPAMTANKLFNQVSTGMAALMQMMAAKGYTVSDANLGTLASVLSAIQTTADNKNPLLVAPYSSSISLDCSKYSGIQITLTGNCTISAYSWSPGQVITVIAIQDSAGGHSLTWPGVDKFQTIGKGGGYITVQQVVGVSPASLSSVAETTLLFTPIQQGTGVGQQPSNVVKIGWDGSSRLKATVDSADQGNFVFDTQLNAATAGIDTNITSLQNQYNTLNAALTAFENLFSGNVSSPGHFYIPVGSRKILVQFGVTPDLGGGTLNVNFDITFPNACFMVVATTLSGTDRITYISSYSSSGFTVGTNGTGSAATYIAIGW
jgi:hypothetical protein